MLQNVLIYSSYFSYYLQKADPEVKRQQRVQNIIDIIEKINAKDKQTTSSVISKEPLPSAYAAALKAKPTQTPKIIDSTIKEVIPKQTVKAVTAVAAAVSPAKPAEESVNGVGDVRMSNNLRLVLNLLCI